MFSRHSGYHVYLRGDISVSEDVAMNSVDNRLYSMTRNTGVKEPQQPVVYQHPHWSVVDGVSSLLPTKKPFHITRIVRHNSESEDGMNDEEEKALNISNSEVDVMSISEENCKMTTADHHLPLANILSKEMKHSEEDGVQSRFRIVKIESKGLIRRGRWTCRDFADPPEAKANDVAETQSAGSTNTAEPVFYVQGAGPAASQFIFYSEGHPVLESDALPCASKLLIDEIADSFSTTETGSALLNMCRPSGDFLSGVSGLKSIGVVNSDAESDGTVVTGLGDMRHNFDRVSWQAGHEEFSTPSLLSLVVDESNELSARWKFVFELFFTVFGRPYYRSCLWHDVSSVVCL